MLFTLWGIAWMVLAVINYSDHDYAEIHGIERSIILCLLGLAIGIPLFILRIWLLIRDGQVNKLRLWGWVSAISGSLFIVVGIAYFLYKYGGLFQIWANSGSIDYSRVFFSSTPLPMFGYYS
jgi:glucan phosphoethanolaminetransferase (alkaline phosphatase superfamily)